MYICTAERIIRSICFLCYAQKIAIGISRCWEFVAPETAMCTTAYCASLISTTGIFTVQAVDSDGRYVKSGTSTFVLQMTSAEGDQFRTTLEHIGMGVYTFNKWPHIPAGVWIADLSIQSSYNCSTAYHNPLLHSLGKTGTWYQAFPCKYRVCFTITVTKASSQRSANFPTCDGAAQGYWQNTGSRTKEGYVYRPFECTYRFLSPKDARQCLATRRIIFIGDSLTRQLAQAISRYSGLPLGDPLRNYTKIPNLMLHQLSPKYVGAQLLAPILQSTAISERISSSSFIYLSSIMHDFANQQHTNSYEMYGVGKIRNGSKVHPFLDYQHRLKVVHQAIMDGKRSKPHVRFLWGLNTVRPRTIVDDCRQYSQDERTVTCGNYIAYTELHDSVKFVDFALHASAAHPKLFKDHVHFTDGNKLNGLGSSALQLLLNTVC